jgi:hypothetical protein
MIRLSIKAKSGQAVKIWNDKKASLNHDLAVYRIPDGTDSG